jgi:hypothetical protein
MPRIRPYTQQESASGVLPQTRSANAADFGGQTADAVQELGASLTRMHDHYERVRKDTLLSGTTAKATAELQEYAYSLKHGTVGEDGTITAPPDPGQHFKLYNDKVKEIGERYGKVFDDSGDAALRGLFDKDFGKVALQQSFNVRTNAVEKQKQMAEAELDETTDTLADIYAKGDEFVRKQVVEQYRGQVARFAAAGVITPVDANKRIDKFVSMTERAGARESIRRDPDGALQAMLDGKMFARTPADEQAKWIDIAARASESKRRADIAEQERLRKEAERAQKEVRSQTYKDAIDLASQGRLTARWVQAQRDNISKEDYDNLMKMATVNGGRLTKPDSDSSWAAGEYAQLRIRAGRGEDVREEAQRALIANIIKPQQFAGIVSEVETNSPVARSPYKSAREYVTRALAPSQINPGIDREVLARALDDLQTFAEKNPNATPEEFNRVRDTIVESSRIVKSQDVLVSIPTPKYLVGEKGATANLKSTYERTKEAYVKREISKAEFERETRNIEMLLEWQKKNPAKPAAEKGKK